MISKKCSLDISNFLKEISSLPHSIVFLCVFHCSHRKAFLSPLVILWNSAFKRVYLSFSPLLFDSLLFTAICKASSISHFISAGQSWPNHHATLCSRKARDLSASHTDPHTSPQTYGAHTVTRAHALPSPVPKPAACLPLYSLLLSSL